MTELLIFYAIGFVLVGMFGQAYLTKKGEYGRGTILTTSLLMAIFWPIWFAVVLWSFFTGSYRHA